MRQKTGQQSSGLGKKGLCGSLSICTRTSEEEVSTSSLRGLWRKGKCFPPEGQQYHLPETGPRCSQPSGPGLFGAWSPQCGTSVPQQVLWDEHDSWSPRGVPAATFVQGVCQLQESRGTRSFRFRDLQACRAKKKKKLSFQTLNPYVIVWFTLFWQKRKPRPRRIQQHGRPSRLPFRPHSGPPLVTSLPRLKTHAHQTQNSLPSWCKICL